MSTDHAATHVLALDQLCINTIRTLSMDAVQQANSGHPGTAMAMAPVVYTLWQEFLRFDPENPIWPNRDRFVLSVAHRHGAPHQSGPRTTARCGTASPAGGGQRCLQS